MKGEGFKFYSSEEVIIAYNEEKSRPYTQLLIYIKRVLIKRRVNLLKPRLVELFSIK